MTPDQIDHWRKVCETQAGIQEFVKFAAEVLFEAGLASQRAVGDHAAIAIRKWSDVMREEALRLLYESKKGGYEKRVGQKKLSAPKL